jgi:hypothetical protein
MQTHQWLARRRRAAIFRPARLKTLFAFHQAVGENARRGHPHLPARPQDVPARTHPGLAGEASSLVIEGLTSQP